MWSHAKSETPPCSFAVRCLPESPAKLSTSIVATTSWVFKALDGKETEKEQRQKPPGTTQDEQLLESPRPDEFTHTDTWRVFRIMGEFVEGFDELATLTRGISIFGSARTRPDDPDYKAAQETAALCSQRRDSRLSQAAVRASWKPRIAAHLKLADSQSAATSSCRSSKALMPTKHVVSRSNTSSCAR